MNTEIERKPKKWKATGVTYRGQDCETKAALDHEGRLWITDSGGKWLRCAKGIEALFTADEQQ